MIENELLLFGQKEPDSKIAWELYEEGLTFNQQINLDEIVQSNENFYIGKQWENVIANGLPTPVYNYLKRVIGFITASITSDRITVTASQLAAAGITDKEYGERMVDVINNEFSSITERCKIPTIARSLARNAAVDGDGCIYTYWDDTVHTGMYSGTEEIMGGIKKELVDNTRVFFGDPQTRAVQEQPYIIISSRDFVRNVKIRAKENGSKEWSQIQPDTDRSDAEKKDYQRNDKKCTVLLLLWKDGDTGTIWSYECTQNCTVKKPTDLGIRLYPLTWLNWDYVQDSYHGQAMITGLIPNQIFVNKMWALIQLSLMRNAFGKVIYDKTRIARWDNAVGAAIGVNGNVDNVAKNIDPPPISPQIAELINLAVEMSEKNMGATAVAMGDTRPDNTSAIVALTRAANTPHEITKQNLYDSIEDSYRIDLEFMMAYYGVRPVLVPPTTREAESYQFTQQPIPETVTIPFDFSQLINHPVTLKLDVGASTYWSETASIQTMDNLLMNNHMLCSEYLDRVPEDFIPKRRELIESVKNRELASGMAAPLPQGGAPAPAPVPAGDAITGEAFGMGGGELTNQVQSQMEVEGGSGNGALQRAIAGSGRVPGVVL